MDPHRRSEKALAKMCFPGIGTISPPYSGNGGWVGIGVQPKFSTAATTGSVGLAPSHGRAVATEAATATNVQKLVIRSIAADCWTIIDVIFFVGYFSSFRSCSESSSEQVEEKAMKYSRDR
jgi:hypothetical protein